MLIVGVGAKNWVIDVIMFARRYDFVVYVDTVKYIKLIEK
jgi:hypothetical protein